MNAVNTINKITNPEAGLFNQADGDAVWKDFSEGLLNYRMSKNSKDSGKRNELLKQAVKKFTNFISLKPDYNLTYCYLGISYFLLGNYNLALKALNEAITGSKERININLILYRGIVYQKLLEYKKALNDYSFVLEQAPDNTDAYYHRALLHIASGYPDEAISDLSNTINLYLGRHINHSGIDPEYPAAEELRILRAECYFTKEDYHNAIYDYSKVLDAEPDNEIRCKRGECFYLIGEYDNALADLSEVVENDRLNYEAYYLRGSVYIAQADYERAVFDFTSAIGLFLNNTKAYIRRAYAYSYLGSHTEALKDLETAKELCPENPELHRTYGVVFLNMHMRIKNLKIAASLGDKVSQNWLKKKRITY